MRGHPVVATGLDVLRLGGFAPLRGLRVGLVTHTAAVDRDLRQAVDVFRDAAEVKLVRLFGPEHGLVGHAQDLEGVESPGRTRDGIEIVSLYGASVESLRPATDHLRDLDAVVVDLVDIGSRYYTFQATMLYCFEEAARRKLLTVVLDRPNPLGGLAVEGPALLPGFGSFVGAHPIATRHGLTIGELARLYKQERQIDGELIVVPCEGWRRGMYFDATGLPWVLPSPNMPTLDTAIVYPGQCLIEGTNLSEGRGTTRPFELCGAAGVDAEALAARLAAERLPGVVFRAAWFRPTFQKHAGKLCGGVQLHVADRETFQPVRTSLAVLAALRHAAGAAFAWRSEVYEFVSDVPAIDLLFGSDRERLGLESGRLWRELARAWEPEEEAFRGRRRAHLLYD